LVTAVLADVGGSAELVETVGTEAWAEVMNDILDLLGTQVYRYGGEIDHLGGDQLVACFGATTAHEDDPERAVLALLAMREAFQARVRGLPERERAALRLRIVANTGDAIVATSGEGRRYSMDTAIGEALVVARRIQETTPPGGVLVSENTYCLVQPLFEWASPEEIAIEGTSEPIAAYRPLARRVLPGKERGVAGISSPLVGRQPELRALQKAVTRLQAGMGGIVTLVGEAGMGKSRLVAEVRRQSRAQDPKGTRRLRHSVSLQWVEGRCLSYRTSIAYHLWLDMLRELLGTAPDAPPPTSATC
jgi:class 3 adenylate cyclase